MTSQNSGAAPALAAARLRYPLSSISEPWRQIAIAIGAALFLLGLGGALFLSNSAETIRLSSRHALEIETAATDLLNALVRAESSQRGYLLSQDEAYLRPYLVSRVNIQSMSNRLSRLVAGDAEEAAQVAMLRPLIEAKIVELETTVDLAQKGARERALAIVRSDEGLRLMTQLSERTQAIAARAAADLEAGRVRLDRNAIALRTVIIATIVIGLILMASVARARTMFMHDLTQQNLVLEERVRERTAALEARTKRVETLMQDMSHRIGNSLSLVTGFLDLQARASKSDEVKGALAAARQRVFSIASAQRRMRLAMDSDTVDTIGFLDALIDDFRNALPDHRIAVLTDIAPCALPSQDAAAFGMILNELLANAAKHAWEPDERGEILVSFRETENERILTISDDGRGVVRNDMSGGLGEILVQSLVQSMRGAMTKEPANPGAARAGLRCTITAPKTAP